MSSSPGSWRLVAGCPVATPADDLCLYHCVSFLRDPHEFLRVPRSSAGHFLGPQAVSMRRRAEDLRRELMSLLQAFLYDRFRDEFFM